MKELMNGKEEELPDLLSEAFFTGIKKQMLLGMIASDTVEEILSPLLRDYNRLLPLLSPGLRKDIENILKVYPEIASRYRVVIKPSVAYVLDTFWDMFKGVVFDNADDSHSGPPPEGMESLDLAEYAMEDQKALDEASGAMALIAGRSIIDVDRGEPVILEVAYERKENRFCFECPALQRKMEMLICGRPVLVLQPERNRECLTAREYIDIVRQYEAEGGEGIEIELREQE